MGIGQDEPDFDPDRWPSALSQTRRSAGQSRAWRSAVGHLGPAVAPLFVAGIVLVILAGSTLSERMTRDEARSDSDGLPPLTASSAATPPVTLGASPTPALTAQTTSSSPKVVYAGPPPPRLPVRLDEPVLYWLPEILAASERTGVPAALLAGVIQVESQGDPAAVSPAGARGLMQLMPRHLEEQGIDPSRWHDPATNIHAGALLLKWKIEASGTQREGVRYYFGPDKCDAFTCTEEYVSRVYTWHDHYAPLIANPNSAGVRMFPAK